MTLEELEKEWEEKQKKDNKPPTRYGSGCAGSACGDYARDCEEWEDYMQYGMGGVYPRDHYGFRRGD